MANPTHSAPSEAERHADHGVARYYKVWAILIVCTFLTVWTGHKDLGDVNIFLAMAIATLKATLVVLFFMHMSEAAGANRLVFVMSIVFAMVMMIGVFGDLWTRAAMTLPSDAPSTLGPEL